MDGKKPRISHRNPQPGWIPLRRALFLYRVGSGEDGPGWENGTPDAQFEHMLRSAGVLEAKINRDTAQVELTLPSGRGAAFDVPVHFYPDKFDPSEIKDPQLRAALSEAVALVQEKLVEEFMRAAPHGRYRVLARPNSVLAVYVEVAPDVLPRFTVTNWALGDAEAESGDKLYSIHIAPPTSRANDNWPPLGTTAEKICTYLLKNWPKGKPAVLSYEAVAAPFRQDTKLQASDAHVRQMAQKYLGWPRRG